VIREYLFFEELFIPIESLLIKNVCAAMGAIAAQTFLIIQWLNVLEGKFCAYDP